MAWTDADDTVRTALAAHLTALPDKRQVAELLALVRAEVADVLGDATVGAVGADRAFRELGLTSATAVVLRTRLAARTGQP
jgi:hypothetical protein